MQNTLQTWFGQVLSITDSFLEHAHSMRHSMFYHAVILTTMGSFLGTAAMGMSISNILILLQAEMSALQPILPTEGAANTPNSDKNHDVSQQATWQQGQAAQRMLSYKEVLWQELSKLQAQAADSHHEVQHTNNSGGNPWRRHYVDKSLTIDGKYEALLGLDVAEYEQQRAEQALKELTVPSQTQGKGFLRADAAKEVVLGTLQVCAAHQSSVDRCAW